MSHENVLKGDRIEHPTRNAPLWQTSRWAQRFPHAFPTQLAARPASRGGSIALALAITAWSTPTRAEPPELTGPPAPTGVSGFAPVAPLPAGPDSFEWTPVTINDREYLKASDVASFYRFPSCKIEETAASFRSPTLEMKWEADGSLLTINETKFLLTTPCLKRAEGFLIARVDLVKWIDPLLRPAYLSKSEWFDTVVIDPGHGGTTVARAAPSATKRLTPSTSLVA